MQTQTYTIETDDYQMLMDCIERSNKYIMQSMLLNRNQKTFNIIENFILQMSNYHLSKIKIPDKCETYIEFWYKDNVTSNGNFIHAFHFDKDEKIFQKHKKIICPNLSTITYLNDSIYPTLITNITHNVDNNDSMLLSFPKKLKHISFCGDRLHCAINALDKNVQEHKMNKIESRKTLMFNIWINHKPEGVNEFITLDKEHSENRSLFIIKELKDLKNIYTNPFLINLLTYDIILMRKDCKRIFSEYIDFKTLECKSNILFTSIREHLILDAAGSDTGLPLLYIG